MMDMYFHVISHICLFTTFYNLKLSFWVVLNIRRLFCVDTNSTWPIANMKYYFGVVMSLFITILISRFKLNT